MEISKELEERVRQAILERSKENRISCTQARKVAEEFDVPVRYVGNLINDLKIKIWGCELGCF